MRYPPGAMVNIFFVFHSVSTFPEARRQQTTGDVAETQEIQEQNDPWLQDARYWSDQHGTGTGYCQGLIGFLTVHYVFLIPMFILIWAIRVSRNVFSVN